MSNGTVSIDKMFKGESLSLNTFKNGIVEIRFENQANKFNTLDAATLDELEQALELITDSVSNIYTMDASDAITGVIVSSGKSDFIVGANIYEFPKLFAGDPEVLGAHNREKGSILNRLEDLPVPTVSLLQGLVLGGGFELAMATDYRIATADTQAALPEVGLGILPGFGGTVRLPRLIGTAPAIDWIVSGKHIQSSTLLDAGAIDATAEADDLIADAVKLLQQVANDSSWQEKRQQKLGAVIIDSDDKSIDELKAKAGARGPNYPAALAVTELIEQSQSISREKALLAENSTFIELATSSTAQALVQLFINDQALKKQTHQYTKNLTQADKMAVLGAGIMGGGIAYTAAVRGVSVVMKDIVNEALIAGMSEAEGLLDKQVKKGRMNDDKAKAALSNITPTLDFNAFDDVAFVVEAVVENLKIKKSVLKEVETKVSEDTIIATNTSSLSIADLAEDLARPQNFVGMHFFNPVPIMPLVEIIRGPKSSDEAIATAVNYAATMRKTPVVVKDCAGFLVNRILTAQFVGFIKLIRDGADFEQVDKVMEAFGWPMGPAYLQDVIGMDTSRHVIDIITASYPERMQVEEQHVIALMAENGRYGQKNALGFYRYEKDDKGRLQKLPSEDTKALIAQIQPNGQHSFTDQQIIDRLMLPMVNEAALCFEDKVADSAAEIDMSLILGAGFPRHWGGPLKYADIIGLDEIVKRCERYENLGGCYRPTQSMLAMAKNNERFHQLT
ncbi:fatty acid oxidation complex subunit alpha FadB [uncultured Psychrobacter sp.]|uniref:fatty acid oxidation complex subunit alpha FadB n=1 Tax=uncultured Psychrobacter sp. TaxID=259303 RepID=UPI0034594F30